MSLMQRIKGMLGLTNEAQPTRAMAICGTVGGE